MTPNGRTHASPSATVQFQTPRLPRESGALITAVETTNRVLMEEALRAGEEKYRSAMILGRMGSWEVDFVKGVRIWTPEGMDLFGINLVDGLGHVGGETDELHRAMDSEDRHLLARYHALADGQNPFPAEYRIETPDGQIRWLSGYGRVLDRQPDGRARRLADVAADVTERKAAEAHQRFLPGTFTWVKKPAEHRASVSRPNAAQL